MKSRRPARRTRTPSLCPTKPISNLSSNGSKASLKEVQLAHPTNDRGEAPAINDLIPLARLDFGIFVALVFPVLHGGKRMVPATYVNLIVEALMRTTTTGGRRRLIFNLPPGYMKSTLITVLYTA